MNTERHDTMTKVSDACADDVEILALSIIRMIMAGYSTGDVACWDMAYAGAERHLPPEEAGRLVASLTSLSRAVRAERTGDWHFMPVTCCRVTGDEEAVLRLLAAARGGEARAVTRAAADVTGLLHSPVLERAAQTVARVLADAGADLTSERRGPVNPSRRVH